MSLIEQKVVLNTTENGNTYMHFPVTRAEYVEDAVLSVNNTKPDENGNVVIDVKGDVRSVNGVRPDEAGNVEIKAGVVSVNEVLPDEETGDIDLGERIKDASSRTDILEAVAQSGLDGKTLAQVLNIIQNTYVRSVNSVTPDSNGNCELTPYLINFETLGVSTFAEAPEGWFKVNAGSETYSDCPDTCWGSLLYIKGTGTPCQKYIVDNGHTVYHRSWVKATNTWGEWTSVSNDYVTKITASGTTVTYTLKSGATGTFTTQDTNTNTSNWSVSRSTNGYSYDNSTGFCIQWGYYGSIASETTVTVTFPRAFKNACTYFGSATPTHNGGSRGIFSGQPISKTQGQITNGNDAVTDARWIAVGY